MAVRERFKTDIVFNLLVYGFLCAVIAFIALPVLNAIASSFSDPIEIANGRVYFLPVKPTLLGYQDVFNTSAVWTGYLNTLFVTVVGVVGSVFLTALAAYPLSRPDFRGGSVIMKLVIVTMTVNGGTIPFFLVVKQLGLIDNLFSLILPFLFNQFNLIVMTSFFRETVPGELSDAARIDGCNNFRFFVQIVLPVSSAVLSVIALYYGVQYWNDFFNALLFLNKKSVYTLPLVLRDILLSAESSMDPTVDSGITTGMYRAIGMRFALIWVASVPMLVVYPLLQRYFVKGVMLGALKG